jgi:hypothetical protein
MLLIFLAECFILNFFSCFTPSYLVYSKTLFWDSGSHIPTLRSSYEIEAKYSYLFEAGFHIMALNILVAKLYQHRNWPL